MAEKCMFKSLLANVFLTIIKITFGYISKSKTLIADGIHCLSDMSTDIIGIIGTKISNKKPDAEHPYGHGKAEYITSLFISMFIIYLSFKIFVNSFTPTYKIDTYYILLVSIISIVVKYLISSYLIKVGKNINSNILITSGTESRFDVLSSAVAFVFILLSLFAKDVPVLRYADTVGSIVISILTLRIGIKLFVENFNSALGSVELAPDVINSIHDILMSYKEVKNIKRITILKYGYYNMVTLDIEMKSTISLKKIYNVENNIKEELRKYNKDYKYININVIPYKEK